MIPSLIRTYEAITVIPARAGFFTVQFYPPSGELRITEATDAADLRKEKTPIIAWAIRPSVERNTDSPLSEDEMGWTDVEPLTVIGRIFDEPVLILDPLGTYTWPFGGTFPNEFHARKGWKTGCVDGLIRQIAETA